MLKHSGDDFDALFAELKKANTWQSPRCAQDSLVSVNKDPVRRALNSAERDKNHYLQTNRALGNYECEPGPKQKVADFKDLVGKRTKFEVFVNWANDDTGKAQVYLDGELAVNYAGPTLTKALRRSIISNSACTCAAPMTSRRSRARTFISLQSSGLTRAKASK